MHICKEVKEKRRMIRRVEAVLFHRKIMANNVLHWSLLLNGSLGDYIITLKVVEALVDVYKDVEIDVFVPDNKRVFARAVFYGKPIVHGFYPSRFHNRFSRFYDLSLAVTHYSQVVYYDEKRIKILSSKLLLMLEQLKERKNFYDGVDNEYYRFIMRCKFWGLNRYTALGNGGIISITDKSVHINIDCAFEKIYKIWRRGLYITTNYGVDMVTVKMWPKEYLEKLFYFLKQEFPQVDIVQLGGQNATKLNGIDRYVLGKSLELTKYILRGSLLHIDCEGGLVHLATQLGTKCAVIFGPTPVWYYGYEENINIVSKNCCDCEGVVPDWYSHCMLGEERPKCMYSIMPEFVFSKVKKTIALNICEIKKG